MVGIACVNLCTASPGSWRIDDRQLAEEVHRLQRRYLPNAGDRYREVAVLTVATVLHLLDDVHAVAQLALAHDSTPWSNCTTSITVASCRSSSLLSLEKIGTWPSISCRETRFSIPSTPSRMSFTLAFGSRSSRQPSPPARTLDMRRCH